MKIVRIALMAALLIGPLGSGLALTQSRGITVVAKTPDGKQIDLYRSSYALVVGVSAYTSGWPRLPNAVADAREVQTTLQKHGFVVSLVENPSAAQLESAIKDFIASRGRGKDDRLLFYFAGHGHTEKTAWGGELGYIVPADAPLPRVDPAGFIKKAISMESFNTHARTIDSKHALFLFDSCFSGSIFALSRAVPDAISYKTSQPVRQFITAGSAEEQVPDRSVFRQQFVAALSGEGDSNGDGYITGTELGEFLQTKVVNYSRESQHPQYGKIRDPQLDKGDFVFVVPSAEIALQPTLLPPQPGGKTLDLSRYETEAARLSAVKAQWEKWQTEMSASFQKAQTLDRDPNLSASSKAQMWQEFLNTYADDNRYSQEDDDLRSRATSRQNYWRTYQPPRVEPPKPARTSVDIEFAFIPGGTFDMGDTFGDGGSDEKPVHTVTLSDFHLSRHEITVAQFREFCQRTGRTMPEQPQWNKENHPVVNVTWDDARAFCVWAGGRLPTEAEWEYAAREGGKRVKFGTGKNELSPSDANYGAEDGYTNTAPVASFSPNALGLYDMTGNVWEWCQDWYDENYYRNSPTRDPKGPVSGTLRVWRGGSWLVYPDLLRCAVRLASLPSYWDGDFGFRCAQDVR